MPITVTCLGCKTPLTFPEEQAAILALCPACAAEVSAPRRRSTADTAVARRTGDVCHGCVSRGDDFDVPEEPVPIPEPANEPPGEKPLELGPRWRQVETAFAWIHFGIGALITGLFVSFFSALLKAFFDVLAAIPLSLLQYPMFAIAGFTVFVGQVLCLRVPTATRARPAAICCLAGRLLALGLGFYGAMYWWEAETDIAIQGRVRESMLLTASVLFLGGWMASLLVEFSFLVLLTRVGRFLEDRVIVRHARLGNRILIVYLIASLVLSAASIAWMYHSILGEIEAFRLQYPQIDPQPRTWLISRISYILFATKNTSPFVAKAQFGIAAVVVVFWIALASQYRAALNAAKAAIRDGLERREASEKGLLVFPVRRSRENP